MDKRIQIAYEGNVHFMKHELRWSSSAYYWMSNIVKNFLIEHGVIDESSNDFLIYDEDDEPHNCHLDNQERFKCYTWFKKYDTKNGDWVVIFVVGKKAVFIHCPKA